MPREREGLEAASQLAGQRDRGFLATFSIDQVCKPGWNPGCYWNGLPYQDPGLVDEAFLKEEPLLTGVGDPRLAQISFAPRLLFDRSCVDPSQGRTRILLVSLLFGFFTFLGFFPFHPINPLPLRLC